MSDADPLAALRRPRRALRAPFMLTPLIDVLFLLLIFFMLTSQTSPFAMLTVSTAGRVVEEPESIAAASGAAPQILVQIDNGRVAINGAPVEASALSEVLAEYETTSPVVVLLGRSATVQDAVGILEVLSVTDFASVQVASRGAS